MARVPNQAEDDEYSFLRPYLEEEEENEPSEEYSFLAPYMEKPKVAEPAAPEEEITEEYEFLRPYMEQPTPARPPSLIRAEAPTLESLGINLPQPIVESVGQLEGIKNAAMNAFDSSRQAMAVAGGVSPEEAEEISRLEYQKEARKISPAYSEYLQAEGLDAVKAFAKNPFEITTNIVAEGLAGSLYSLGAGVAAGGIAAGATAATGVGAPLAPAAFLGGQIGGTFAGSLATEYGGKVLEELQNAGMDIKDPESIQKFFGDEKLMEGARSQALKRGVPVAIFDGVSAGIGGRLARLPVQALTKTPTRLAVTEGVTQATLGGLGEVSGAVAAGEEIQPKAVFAEVIGEAGPAAAEITVGRIAERMARTPEQKKLDQTVLATQVATRASQDIAPATADAVERQVQDTLAETAETPEQRVARLQREAQEGAGIELEEEVPVSGLPPERIKSARWFESASRNRLKELQDKDDAGVEDFTTQERDEFEFLKASPTPEQIAQRYGYGVAPAVEPTAVTTTTQPTTPAMTEPAPVEPEPTLTPSPAVTEPTAPTTLQPDLLTPEGKIGEERSTIDQENRRKTEEFINGLEDGEYQVFDSNGEKNGIAKVRTNKSGKKVVEYVTDDRRGFIGDAKSLVPELNFARFTDATTGKEGFDRGSIQKLTPPATEAAPEAAVTPPPVEPPALAPLRRVVKAEQTEEDVSGLVGQGLVELYNGQPVITQAGLEALPEAERPRLTPEARKIQIDTRTSEAAAEAISKNLRIGVDQVPVDVRMPAGWTLVGDVYVPPVVEAEPAPARLEPKIEADLRSQVVSGFEARSKRHKEFSEGLNKAVAANSLTEDGAILLREVFKDADPKLLGRATISINSRRRYLGVALRRGGTQLSDNAIEKALDGRFGENMTPEVMAMVVTHEIGHHGYSSILTKRERALIGSIFTKMGEKGRSEFFSRGAIPKPFQVKYHAKNQHEFFAQSFAEYVFSDRLPDPEIKPIFDRIIQKLKDAFQSLMGRNANIEQLVPLYEKLLGGRPAPQPEARESRRATTPQQDTDYLAAVERGDMEMAQRMVDEAARAAGYTHQGLFHGSSARFDRFMLEFRGSAAGGISANDAFFLSDSERTARGYAVYAAEDGPVKRLMKDAEDAEKRGDWDEQERLMAQAEDMVYGEDGATATAERRKNAVVYSLFARGNFLEVDAEGKSAEEFGSLTAMIEQARRKKLDGVIFRNLDDAPYLNDPATHFAIFGPANIKSADPVTYDDQGNVIPLSQRFQQVEADIRYNPLGYDITNVVEDIKAGRTDGPLRAVNNVVKEAAALRDRVKAEAERRQRPRAIGKASILERIARERSSGKLSEETAQALTDFVNSIREEAIGDTAISIKGAGAASNFDFGQSLVTFFLTQDQPKVGARVGIHEFWHGLSRFLPKTEAEKMAKDYTQALSGYLKDNPWFLAFVGRYSLTPEQFEEYKLFNPKEAETKLVPVQDSQGNIVKYQIKYDADNYRYIMLDEWIAEKMTDLVESRQAMPNTFIGKLAKIIKEFLAQIQAKLGRDAYRSFYNLVTDPNQKIDLQRMGSVARPFQIYQPQDYNYAEDISDQIRYATIGAEPEPRPTFTEESPEAKTLSNLKASMEKVDVASEAKGGKPETQKVSEIAANWMEQGGDERALQDAITENTNLSPVNAAKVAKVIAKQYDIQQSIATAFLETQMGLSVEALPEGVTLPKEVDPDRPKPVMQRLFDVFMGVRVPPVKIEVNEKAALKDQIRLKAAANRAAKAEQKRTAEEVVEIIKAMELLGPVRPKQVQALAKRAARVIWTSEKSVEAFSEYAAKVVENANYDADLREAKDAQKRAKQLSTQKKVAMSPQREVLEDVNKVPVNKLDDPRMFAEAVNYYLRGFKAVLSPDYVVIPDAEMESYLSGAQSETQRNQRDLDREANERLARKYGIEPDQVNEMMESIDIIKQIEAQENREALDNLLTEKAVETQQGLRGYDADNLRADQRPIVSSMLKVDPKALDPEERQRFIRITNNIIYNNQTNGAEYFVAVAKGQQSAREAAQDSTMVAKNRAWINLLPRFVSERMQRGWALELQSIADTFRNAFGKGAMAQVYDLMGMLDLNIGFTNANNTIDEIQKKIAEFHRGLEKKYKETARNQDGLLAEGIVGFLIQSIPKKDEVTSINQRRDLIRQDVANRKRSAAQPDRIAMADRIETILNRIDGESVEAVLNNMKREFPANHESLIWYKDTLLPQYKDFLKNFDENFNDQANNYDNPNYLTIGFTSAGPSLAITPEEQGMFYDQVSLRPKQSAYTIKRVDYSVLPKDRTTDRPKEIEFNLRRNVFNGLSDQINKAYTSSAWQRIASFMKTPEAEEVFGGAANKDFFIERLNRLRLSRMRRGSMGSGGAIEKAVDSLSIISRKLGTGIALGGIYQWIKQPPDQLITAWGSGGRGDLLARNIAPSTQKAARELLNKFSIGRRGDASAGYKYINQMEGHQNRLERYFSESKWDQAKEQAGKIADVWMVALKSSDFLAASAAWMTYYEGGLNKKDIKIDDWSKEAALIESDPARRQAAAFAEQMTDIYQGSSDPTSMATFAQSGKTGWENLVKAIFVPFNSFAIQQRMRLYSDAVDAINGNKSGVGGLAGTIGGLILFHATKRYVIPAISGVGIGVLYGLMGVDMDEPDEEKQKEEANKNWRQFLADLTGNLLVGGTPQIVESQFIDAMNRASYLVSLQLENDSILNDEGEIMSYDQYSKERSPFYRYKSYDNAMSLGMLDIGMGQAEQVALQTKMLASPEEMEMYTPEEQRLLYFSALSEWLLLMRLNDTDFARLVKKARRDMIKAAEDREKDIKAIRSGR